MGPEDRLPEGRARAGFAFRRNQPIALAAWRLRAPEYRGRDRPGGSGDQAMTRPASAIGITNIDAGVETAGQSAQVQAGGCTDIQGYLISRTVPADGIDGIVPRFSATSSQS